LHFSSILRVCYAKAFRTFFIGILTVLNAFFRFLYGLGLETLALRQQLGILKRKQPRPSAVLPPSSVVTLPQESAHRRH